MLAWAMLAPSQKGCSRCLPNGKLVASQQASNANHRIDQGKLMSYAVSHAACGRRHCRALTEDADDMQPDLGQQVARTIAEHCDALVARALGVHEVHNVGTQNAT